MHSHMAGNQSPTHMPAPPPSRCSPSTSPDTSDNDEHTSASLLTTNTTTTTHTDNSIDQEVCTQHGPRAIMCDNNLS